MLKPEELRIGNYVSLTDSALNDLYDWGEILVETNEFKVTMVQSGDCNLEVNNDEIDFDLSSLQPIPLDEEWLLKLGFEPDDKDDCLVYYKKYVRGKYGYIVVNGKTFDAEVGASGYLAITIKKCNVHQLQNLFYSLIGKELKVIG